MFLGVSSQWRLQIGVGAVLWQAPAYVDVDRVLTRYSIGQEDQDDVFQQYQVLEAEALKHMNEKLKKD